MSGSRPTAGPAPHLMDEILALLTPLQAMRHRHQEQLDVHRTADGDVIEEQRSTYEEVRAATAMEASDTLDVVIKRLDCWPPSPPAEPSPWP
ncbi:hypothetical protein [Streptomyces sp. H39-C1]|uniref:hypothetical protein n=1 Tax=Streptomyces sp. H39-C1 TaxID=3004355 RepID=UPI0022AE75D5|nr:hypothetical protein [Streptomyces sp. H39-C1]MCZ4102923.1 hypothetical protein [Streptomyces sp. H39-C1]